MIWFFFLEGFEVSVIEQKELDLTYKYKKIWGAGYSLSLFMSAVFTHLWEKEHTGLVGAPLHMYIKCLAKSSRQRRSWRYFTAQSASIQEHANRAKNTAQDDPVPL